MDLSPARGPLPTAEKQRRINLGLCLYCGEGGHIARFCAKRPVGIRSMEISEERVIEIESENE